VSGNRPDTGKEDVMSIHNKILRSLGRIEGELIEIRKLSERVSRLEAWHSWLKGLWAVLAAACAYIYKGKLGK
jgi:hypothetical protein